MSCYIKSKEFALSNKRLKQIEKKKHDTALHNAQPATLSVGAELNGGSLVSTEVATGFRN